MLKEPGEIIARLFNLSQSKAFRIIHICMSIYQGHAFLI